MSSAPIAFSVGSQSASSVIGVIASYRRAQLYLSDYISASATESDEEEGLEGESVIDEEAEIESGEPEREDGLHYDAVVGNFQWDEDLTSGPSDITTARQFLIPRLPTRSDTEATVTPARTSPTVQEHTPLLHKTTSLSFLDRPVSPRQYVERTVSAVPKDDRTPHVVRRTSQLSAISRTSSRRMSTGKVARYLPSGQSTFGQTLFNTIAILLGIGMLSEPLAFAYAGWFGGFFLIVSYGLVTCYTAKILAHIILDDPKLKSYSDIARKAFGPRSGPWVGAVFCLELFTVSVALVTLYADSLHSVVPEYSTNLYKVIGLIVLVPTMLMPLSVLSYTSILGILSIIVLIVVIFIDGFSKYESPGSLWSPAHTSWSVGNMGELGVAFGLFMAGFSGHAVIPSLLRDMVDPSQFDIMIDYAFLSATMIYAIIGVAGYLMFGNSVSDEFSKDLMKIPNYNPVLNQIALWGLVLSPLSKYALATRPLNITLEIMLGIDTSLQSPNDHSINAKPSNGVADGHVSYHQDRRHTLKRALTVVERTVFAVLSVGVSIMIPEFSSMMAFLGAFSSFLLCVIGPVSAKIALAGRAGVYDLVILGVAIVMAIWGTGAAFWSTT